MNWYKPWFIGTFISIVNFSTIAVPISENAQLDTDFKRLHQCTKTFDYDFYLAGINIGYSHRVITWNEIQGDISAEIDTTGEVSLFGIGSTYHQRSHTIWSKQEQHFITQKFSQVITGIKARELMVTTSELGRKSTVNLDGEISEFNNKKAPLLDLDTLGSQLRVNLAQGKTTFTLYGQGSEEIKPYIFKVVGKEVIELDKWGEINTIKVIEIGEYDDMVLWFSPKHDWQLVKADIDAFVSPSVLLTDFKIECH